MHLSLCFNKKYGDETGLSKQLNDEMLESPEDEAENSDEPSKSIEIPVQFGELFSENKASLLAFRVHLTASHSSFYFFSERKKRRLKITFICFFVTSDRELEDLSKKGKSGYLGSSPPKPCFKFCYAKPVRVK